MRVIFCLFYLLLIPTIGQAQIFANKTIYYWGQQLPPVQNVAVRNGSDKTLLVTVNVVEVENPGGEDQKHVPSEDIIVTPKRFSVTGNGERTVRLLRRGEHGQRERVFRISFVPEAREEDDIATTSVQTGNPNVVATLKVLTGIGLLVFTQPAAGEADLEIERREGNILLKNNGNVNIALLKVQKCVSEGNQCEDVVPRRVYPGRSFEVKETKGKVVYLRKRVGEAVSEMTIPGE